jgi:MFS family permease
VNTLFYVTYVVFETPWVMAVKRWGANSVLAVAFICWSAVTIGTGFIQNYGQAIVMRLLLGIFEAGLFPALTFVISTIYDRDAQAKRVAVLYGSSALSGAFGGLIAYGIQLMGARRGLSAWRWLFIVEGCISMVICGCALFTLPKTAETAWFLTEDEKSLMRARTQRDIIYKGDNTFSWAYARMALSDPFIYLTSVLLFCSSIPLFGFGTFLPTIIKGLG